jgi:uracil-DNA glycosylase
MSLIFLNYICSWKTLTLWNYLLEGNIPKNWNYFFEHNKHELFKISKMLETSTHIFPKVFRSFINPSIVILGQDPYHNGSAVGYCFSVLPGNNINPSLNNIYTELKNNGYEITKNGILNHWVDQGCFMLNTSLTLSRFSYRILV